MKTFQSTPLTFIDQTDSRKLEVYIKSNLPTMQIFNQNTGAYTPDWREGEKLMLSMDVFLDSRAMTTSEYNATTIKWYKNDIEMTDGSIEDISDDKRKIIIKDNILKDDAIITYTCEATYQGIVAASRITFTRVDSGINGSDGADGTSVNIKATATSVTPITGTDYYTITYEGSDVSAAELNDAYMYNGDLYVCVDSRDGVDYFINVGRIQGPEGKPAKNIILTGSAQVFKVSKTNVVTPSTISVTAHTFNTSVTSWSYSTNGGQTFLSTVPTGISRNGNIVTITGATITSNSIVIKASDGTIEDVFTIYKASDGTDGNPGDPGDPAPIAFLTNENVTFSANAQGQITGTTITSNVVAYNGTTKVLPTVGTPTGMPTGMTISKSTIAASNEIMLTITIANNATLGSASNNMGTISIPITSPVSTVLTLTWSKVNAGAPGVGISSTTVAYGVSDSASTRPADDAWQATIPAVADGKYLWTRTVIDYTDTSKPDTVTYSYAKQGAQGGKGDPGTPASVSSIQYQEGQSATIPPTGTWSTSIVAVADGRFLWTKTTFSDGKIAYGVAKQGNDGSNFRTFTTEYETNQTSMEKWASLTSSEWNVNESTSGTKVGDTVMLRCYNTTKQGYSYILATVISIPGDKVIHTKSIGLLDKGDAGTDAYTVILTNESNVFVGDVSNALAGETSTQVLAYLRNVAQTVTIVSVNGVSASTSATATGIAGLTFQCNALTGTSPIITFKCTTAFKTANGTIPIKIKVGNIEFIKIFTYSIAFKGTAGTPSSSYWLVANASAVQKTTSGDILCTPATLTFTGRTQTGTSTPANYSGRWILAYSTDGSTYTNAYTSATNEATASITASETYKAIRARMYLAGGTTTLLDEQIIPFVSDGETGGVGAPGDPAVTFQVYSNNGYALSTSVPTILLQTFAYLGDVEITAGATYQWYRYNGVDWIAVSEATNSYFTVSRDDVSFSNNYMCKMTFNGVEYVGVVTIDDKNDENKVFASKPSNYFAGDIWIVGTDYAPSGFAVGTMLRAEHTNNTYADSDWVPATKYDDEIEDLKSTVDSYKQYFSVNSTNGFQIGNSSINNDILTTNQVETTIINSDVANVETINVTGRYSGSTMLQAPILNLGNFSFVIEGNGSLSIVANT